MLLKRAYLIVICTAILFSCKKEKDDPAIFGFWKGKYGGPTNYPNNQYSFLFRSNGTVRVFDGSDTATAAKAEGTFSITGNTVQGSYIYEGTGNLKYSVTGTVDPKMTFIEGTWGNGDNATDGGHFFLNKQ